MGILGVYGGPEFVVEYSNGDRTSYVMTVFDSRIVGGTLCPRDDESTDTGYFSLDEIMHLEIQPWVRIVLPDIFERKRTAQFKAASWKPDVESDEP